VKTQGENTGRGVTRGWFTLVAGEFEINDMSLVKGPKGDFVGFPQRSYEKDGETKYASIIWMPDEKRRYAFQDWAKAELKKIIGVEPEPEDGSGEDIPF